jgi:hypothetical protein
MPGTTPRYVRQNMNHSKENKVHIYSAKTSYNSGNHKNKKHSKK